ncbi:hypothetical protein DFQ26_005495, partial [Actinomortierella ambigua]
MAQTTLEEEFSPGAPKKRGRPPKAGTPFKKKSLSVSPCTSLFPRIIGKKYTIAQLKERNAAWDKRYKDLLTCARTDDCNAALVLPEFKEYELLMVKSCQPVHVKVELLDIYHYLKKRQRHIQTKVTYQSFGPMIGVSLPKQTFSNWIRNEGAYRNAALSVSKDARYI